MNQVSKSGNIRRSSQNEHYQSNSSLKLANAKALYRAASFLCQNQRWQTLIVFNFFLISIFIFNLLGLRVKA